MGEAINHFFESQMQWFYDNGIFYISGRDIACILFGICAGLLMVLIIMLIKYEVEKNETVEK